MPDIYTLAHQHRAALLNGEREAASDLTRAWGAAHQRIERDLARLVAQVEAMRERGEEVGIARLLRMERYRSLLAQIDEEMRSLAERGERSVKAARGEAAVRAIENASEQIGSIVADFNRLPVQAVQAIAATVTSAASPVSDLFRSLSVEGVGKAQDALVAGLAAGHNPRRVAPMLRDALGVSLTRALTISRTESLRAYREGSIAAYQESGVVEKWRWLASKSRRTCPVCLAMDGTLHDLSEPFASHVRCRCTATPWFPGLPPRQTGAEWLATQDEDVQAQVLGHEAARLYRRGELELSDFVGEKTHPRWGRTRYTRPLKEITLTQSASTRT